MRRAICTGRRIVRLPVCTSNALTHTRSKTLDQERRIKNYVTHFNKNKFKSCHAKKIKIVFRFMKCNDNNSDDNDDDDDVDYKNEYTRR